MKCRTKWRQRDRMVKNALLMANMIDTVVVQSLVASLYCVLGKDMLRHFGVLTSSFKFQFYYKIEIRKRLNIQ